MILHGMNVCMKDKYENGLLSIEEWEEAYSEYTETLRDEGVSEEIMLLNSNETMIMTESDTTVVNGILAWECATGKSLPLKQTKVELFEQKIDGTVSLGTTFTNDNGYFSFSVESSAKTNYFVKCYPISTTVQVRADLLFGNYYIKSQTIYLVEPGATGTINYTIKYNESSVSMKAFYVQQGMVIGQRFATAMGMKTNSFINVCYPASIGTGDGNGFCWGPGKSNAIAGIGVDAFNNIDLLIHEYGHFVQYTMGTYGSDLLEMWKNDPSHSVSADHFSEGRDKEYAMELTWSEAWATTFSFIA